MGEIRWRREELTGVAYTAVIGSGDKNLKSHSHPSPVDNIDDHELMYFATLIVTTGRQLASAYKVRPVRISSTRDSSNVFRALASLSVDSIK